MVSTARISIGSLGTKGAGRGISTRCEHGVLLVCVGLWLAIPGPQEARAQVPMRIARPIAPQSFVGDYPSGTGVLVFDMATPDSPVRQGCQRVVPTDEYSKERGFGFETVPEKGEHITDDIVSNSKMTPVPRPVRAAIYAVDDLTCEDLVDMKLGGGSRPEGLPFDGDPRLVIHRDVVYGKTHPEVQKLDAYLVKSPQPTQVVIEMHGGGWRRGSIRQFVYQGNLIGTILDAGISVVAIDYRLTPQHTMPAQLEDAVRAVQFVRSMEKPWNLDPDRMAAMGGSAGAHLAAWVALHDDFAMAGSADPVERCSSRLACFVPLSGPMDLTRVRPRELASQPLRGQDFANAYTAAFGCTAEQYERDPQVRQRIRKASPLFLVSGDDPPAFVMGTWNDQQAVLRDPPVPAVINDPHSIWHGVLLAEALRKAGVSVAIRVGPDVGKDPAADNAALVAFLRQQFVTQ